MGSLLGWFGPVTHRQFLLWLLWKRLEVTSPSPLMEYLMLIACEVRRSYCKPGTVELDHMRLREQEPPRRLTAKEALDIAVARVGGWGRVRIE